MGYSYHYQKTTYPSLNFAKYTADQNLNILGYLISHLGQVLSCYFNINYFYKLISTP